jgi:opacity protein-like surface antigen
MRSGKRSSEQMGGEMKTLASYRHAAIAAPLFFLVLAPATAQVVLPPGGYIRVEAGMGIHTKQVFIDRNPDAENCSLCNSNFPVTIDDSAILGANVGTRFTENLRADIGIDYLTSSTLKGYNSLELPSSGSAKLDSFVALLNGYVDFPELPGGLVGPFVPYVTVGLGLAHHDLGRLAGAAPGGAFSISGANRTNFAYAMGAGLSYPLSPLLTADVQYRYLDLGSLNTGTALTEGGPPVQVTAAKTGSIAVHAVTIGIRFGF